MFCKIIVVLATVCVINASVISGNVFDDEIPENTLSDLEDLVSLKEDDPDTEVASNPKGCNFRECHQRCRRLQFPGGTCVNGCCKCDNFLSAEDTVSESNVEDSVPSRACNNNRCNQLCRKKKFRGGACVGANCYCHKFLSLLEDEISENKLSDLEDLVSLKEDDPDTEVASNPKGCNFRECHQRCRRLKFPGGTCVNGRCKCDNFLNAEDEVSEKTLSDLEDSVSQTAEVATIQSRYNLKVCDPVCRWLNKTSGAGACVDGRCNCAKSIFAEHAVDEYSEFAPRRICRLTRCNRTCTRRGYDSATCVNGRCKCYNKTQAEDVISETSIPVSELSEDERGCNVRACDKLCRKLNLAGGACVNGRCKCDNSFVTEDVVDEYSELATRRICNLRQCNRTCTRRGYATARCVNGWCHCYNKIQRQDISPLNDATSHENEESNVILWTNEEDLIVPSPSACKTVNCNQMCHRLNYAGGWCRFGKCQCY